MAAIDLCTSADVLRYIPAYESQTSLDELIADLITSESGEIVRESGRVIVPFADQPETRSFELSDVAVATRRLKIGDLASAGDTDAVVELLDRDEANAVTVDRDTWRPLYRLKRQQTEEWEPVTSIEFLRTGPTLHVGRTALVTGNWGFPMIPTFIVQACAKRVILRLVSDGASAGTTLGAAIADLNLAGLFASARDAVDEIREKAMIR